MIDSEISITNGNVYHRDFVNADALSDLDQQHREMLLGAIRKTLPDHAEHMAETVLQHTYLRARYSPAEFRRQRPLNALFSLAVDTATHVETLMVHGLVKP